MVELPAEKYAIFSKDSLGPPISFRQFRFQCSAIQGSDHFITNPSNALLTGNASSLPEIAGLMIMAHENHCFPLMTPYETIISEGGTLLTQPKDPEIKVYTLNVTFPLKYAHPPKV